MRTEFKFLIIAVMVIQLIILTIYFHYNSKAYLSQFKFWKNTNPGLISQKYLSASMDLLSFEDGGDKFIWPQIYNKNNEEVGIMLLCVDENFIMYSYNEKDFYIYQAK